MEKHNIRLVLFTLLLSVFVTSVAYADSHDMTGNEVIIQAGSASDETCAIRNDCLSPPEITVLKGATVTFKTQENLPAPYALRGGEPGTDWDGGLFTFFIRVNDPKSHVYDELGVFPYHDPTYDWIEGTVNVVQTEPFTNLELTVIVQQQQKQLEMYQAALADLEERVTFLECMVLGSPGTICKSGAQQTQEFRSDKMVVITSDSSSVE